MPPGKDVLRSEYKEYMKNLKALSSGRPPFYQKPLDHRPSPKLTLIEDIPKKDPQESTRNDYESESEKPVILQNSTSCTLTNGPADFASGEILQKRRINEKGNYLRKVALEPKNLILHSLLGKGAYGEVYLGEDRRQHSQYAVKIFRDQYNANYEQTVLYYLNRCNYPESQLFFPKSYGTKSVIGSGKESEVVDRTVTMEVFQEYAPITRFKKIIAEKKSHLQAQTVQLPDIQNVGQVFFKTIALMHANNQVHLDLSPSNVMLPISPVLQKLVPGELTVGMVKLIDFGSSLIFNEWGKTYGLNQLDTIITTTVTVLGPPTAALYGQSQKGKIPDCYIETVAKVCDLWSMFYLLCHIYSNGDTFFPNSKVYRGTSSIPCWNNSGHASPEYLKFQDQLFLEGPPISTYYIQPGTPLAIFLEYLNSNFNYEHAGYLKSLFFTLLEFNANTYPKYLYHTLVEKLLQVSA